MSMKYVILEDRHTGAKTPICGFDPITHAELVAGHLIHGHPISAGYIHWSHGRAFCHSDAPSLGLEAGDEDSAIITDAYEATSRSANLTNSRTHALLR